MTIEEATVERMTVEPSADPTTCDHRGGIVYACEPDVYWCMRCGKEAVTWQELLGVPRTTRPEDVP